MGVFMHSGWVFVLFAVPALVMAQSPLGTVTGVATDATGSPVPSASVVLTNEDTGFSIESLTNQTGTYTFPNLRPGSYKLKATTKGFRPFETETFQLRAFQTVRQDLEFEVQGTATEVTISASADTPLTTESPSITNRLSSRQILELPTNLRSVYNNAGDSGLVFTMMPLTIPGVVQVGAGAAWLVPGSGANGVRLKVDGIETNFGNFGGPDPVSQPSFESVEEFTANILTNRAEFGGQGQITTVTRAGTNAYHGNLFWYLRNSALDARNAFVPNKPFQNIHNFGASAGGPVRKDSTFFFATYDQTRGVRSYLFSPNVPTMAMRQGNFAGLGTIRNPYNGQPFPNNRIPAQMISPEALRAQDIFYPVPNFGSPALTAGNYRASFNGPEDHQIYELRLDHNLQSGHSLFGRYQYKDSDYEIPGARSALPPQSTGTSTNHRDVHFFTAGDALAISPAMFNEFRAGVVVLRSDSDANNRGQQLLDEIGIQGISGLDDIKGIPNINIAGLTPVTQLLLNPVNDGRWQISDTLSWITGRHSTKFGFEVVRWFINRYLPVESARFGNFSFTNRYTGQPYADFLLGLPTSVTRLDPYPTQYNRFTDLNLFAQDDFKVTPRLTLSYGLRYEYNQPAAAEDGNMYSFDPASGSIIIPGEESRSLFARAFPSNLPVITADQLDLGSSLRRPDRNNFAPRFGLSYQVNDKTVVRGGWGIYYAHFSGAVPAFLSAGPYSISTTSNNPVGEPVFTFADPFSAPASAGTLNVNGVTADLRNAYTMQYNFTVERQLERDTVVRVSYIGSKGSQLPYLRNINQPLPSALPFSAARRPYTRFNNITYAENGANSFYSGLQTQVHRRFSRGLMFTSTWTWAKYLSEVDDTGNAELNTQIENAYDRSRDRGDVYSVPRHQWQNQVLYELPGQGRLLGGWQLNALVNLSTGNYLNPVNAGPDPAGTNVTTSRPDVLREIAYPEEQGAWFDRAVFAIPPAGRFGNAARNSVVGPGYIILNLGIAKEVRFERFGRFQIGASFQNILNHVNLGQPNMTVNNTNGGVITSTHIFPPAGSPRTGQLSLRYSF
jgi:hypothetical protein